jgi:hypothetical protein
MTDGYNLPIGCKCTYVVQRTNTEFLHVKLSAEQIYEKLSNLYS